MMKTFATLAGILIGPFVGYFVTYWLSYVQNHNNCMWRFGAHFGGLLMGAPIGLVTFGVIGFWVGYLLDRKAKSRPPHVGSPQDGEAKIECPNCGAMSGAKAYFGCIVIESEWIATCGSCGHRWGPGMAKYANLLPPPDHREGG